MKQNRGHFLPRFTDFLNVLIVSKCRLEVWGTFNAGHVWTLKARHAIKETVWDMVALVDFARYMNRVNFRRRGLERLYRFKNVSAVTGNNGVKFYVPVTTELSLLSSLGPL